MKRLFQTDDAWTGLVLRVMLAMVIFSHGGQKLFGWFGGQGFVATLDTFTVKMHIPLIFALLAIIAESIGSMALFIGLLTRVAAFGIFCVLVVAIWMVHWQHGFFMNWFGQKKGEGFEYHLLGIGLCVALMIAGGGKWSIDRMISKHWK
jgi:putative oxidoreductase